MKVKIPAWLFVALVCLVSAAQHTAPQTAQEPKEVTSAREKLGAAELAHPGNTVELANALGALVTAELEAQAATDETLQLATRELAVAEAATGERSKAFVNALGDVSQANVDLNHAAVARPFADRAFEIAQKEFPDSEEGINASDELAYVCLALGDFPCAKKSDETAIAAERKPGVDHDWDLSVTLTNYADLLRRIGDEAGAGAAAQESVAAGIRAKPDDADIGVLENNLATHFIRSQDFPQAIVYLNRAIDVFTRHYGPNSSPVLSVTANLASAYSRTGQFPLAWRTYEISLMSKKETFDAQANEHADFARSLAAGGNLTRAIDEALVAGRMSRERFVLEARTLPERQALAYDRIRPRGIDTAISVLVRHSELQANDVYQEIVLSRALVADEMARRQRNLNSSNDPEIGRLLQGLSRTRTELFTLEQTKPQNNSQAMADVTTHMETIERELAEHSAAIRSDERVAAVKLDDLFNNLPAHAALVSYMVFDRRAVEMVDPAHSDSIAYMAFVVPAGSRRIRVFDLGDAETIEDLVTRMRSSADSEANSNGLGSTRNERSYREAGETLRKRVWDPLRPSLAGAKVALVVPDGLLDLIPFAGLPDGKGYLVERAPAIHMLSSERDLIPFASKPSKAGMLAVGAPQFDLADSARVQAPSTLRDTPVTCEQFQKLEFQPLPGTQEELNEIGTAWRRLNSGEAFAALTGADATRESFLDASTRIRVLHVATHAFVLDRSCGDGNPLLHSGLVFAGANQSRNSSILTAQQIASLDLNGMDLAVLSACNTGNGELRDGEGVLGLERAFRIAGARSVVMTLWPVDDTVTSHYMRTLYEALLTRHVSTADAVWSAGLKTLEARRAAGVSTHPWYWAGFVATGWQ
jgi:CHAT domain-containing protein